ncbi:MAG: neutral/alkaline non-lysosomal ceramidase N-terminal domain-containing protein, partial [Bryobacteraceae bacterium]|nr:neutral/alkaline non-lysosomal ceramidase N-terminal domain-containing protein [Bryobacteraceae bacterium]
MTLGKQTALIGVFAAMTLQAGFHAGLAKLDITPPGPIWLSGYAGRTRPSQGVSHRLWAKALAVEDGRRGKAVLVTTDLIGLPRNVSDIVAARVLKEYGIDRARLFLNSSHTHAGPVVRPNLMTMYFLDEPQKKAVEDYAVKLTEDLVAVVGAALGDLAPARISIAHGKTGFAANRRVRTAKGVSFGVENSGPVDHDVPVLAVRDGSGKLRAALFGYACHNTTLGGDNYQISGDYAGAAQLELESMQPGAMAMFLMLTGADQNPNPRGTMAHVEQYGKALATEVNRVLSGVMKPVKPGLRAAYQSVELEFSPHTREQFEQELKTG